MLKRLLILFVIITLGTIILMAFRPEEETTDQPITSFAQCQEAGYPILESYPEKCLVTPDGPIFTNPLQPIELN